MIRWWRRNGGLAAVTSDWESAQQVLSRGVWVPEINGQFLLAQVEQRFAVEQLFGRNINA